MPAPPAPPNLARLVLLAIAAEGLLTLMDALIKQLSPRYPTLEIAFLRYAFGMVGAIVYAPVDAARLADAGSHRPTTACARS